MTEGLKWPRRLYKSRRWERRAKQYRRAHPLCERCLAAGRVTIAVLCHHLREHYPGASELEFFFGPIQSLCHSCHLESHDRPPARGYARDIGIDGWPIDPAHPQSIASKQQEQRANDQRRNPDDE
jgi:5-methylcytosine-specific restriction enzyme A